MADNVRIKSADLIQHFNHNFKSCDLFKLLDCLEKSYADNDSQCNDISKLPICLKSNSELSFPISDMQAIKYSNKEQLELYINFMGLYGVDSPLPQYWYERRLNADLTLPLNEFINIFQHRIYILLYLAWKKFQPILHRENHNPGYLYYLTSFSGGLLHFDKHDKEYAYAGLLGQRIHNAETLRIIITHCLDGIPVNIKQHVPEWLDIKDVTNLTPGRKMEYRLNESALLGNKILDGSSTIIITLGPVLFAKAITLLINQNEKNKLLHMIKLYGGFSCNIKIAMNIIISQAHYLKLSQDDMYLAWNACLGKLNFKLTAVHLGRVKCN